MEGDDVRTVLPALPRRFHSRPHPHIPDATVLETPWTLEDGDVVTLVYEARTQRLTDLGETAHRLVAAGVPRERLVRLRAYSKERLCACGDR